MESTVGCRMEHVSDLDHVIFTNMNIIFMMRKRHALAKIPDGRHRGSIQNERVPCISRSQDRSDLIIISTRILLHQDYSVITLSTAEITSSVMGTGQ